MDGNGIAWALSAGLLLLIAAAATPTEYSNLESSLLRTKQVTTPSIRLTQRYKSMHGPKSIRSFQLEAEPDNARVCHGFQTLEDDSEVFVQTSELEYPVHARGVRWNDPALEIEWPRKITEIAEGDLEFPDLEG